MATLRRRSAKKQPPHNLLNAFFLTMSLLSATYFFILASRGDNAHRNYETIPTSTSIGVFISLYELTSVLFTIFIMLLGIYFIYSRRTIKVYAAELCSPATLKHVTSRVAGVNGTPVHYSKCSAPGYHVQDVTEMRKELEKTTKRSLEGLPFEGFEYESYSTVYHEMAVGYVQVPVGVVGPLLLDGREFFVPMATTEGCLVASTNRGCKAVYLSGGAYSTVLRDGSTEAPMVRFGSAKRAAEVKFYLEDPANFDTIADVFGRYGRLQSIKNGIAGKNLYMRFSCSTGDVTGVDMSTKGVQSVLSYLHSLFPDMDVIGISDKKPTALNWIEGRGKSVVCEATIKEEVVKKVLKTSVETLIELNTLKNLAGSAVAGSLGGFNAHASNIVTAIYIATGQDPAHNVESSNCITMVEAVNHGKDLHVSVTMPSIEVGTVGGGTQLASQAACLNLLGVKGANKEKEGENSRLLAKIIAASVLAGELSLLSAIAAGQLVNSHMKYNRSSKNITMLPSGSSTQ